jgi:hypothetical protein
MSNSFTQPPAVASAPTAGKGLALDLSGKIPQAVRKKISGYELAYEEFSATVNCQTGTVSAPIDVVSAGTVSFDGATRVKIEFFSVYLSIGAATTLNLDLWEDAASIGMIALSNIAGDTPCGTVSRFLIPASGNHVFKVSGYLSAGVGVAGPAAGVGASGGVAMPGFIRITVA